MSADGSINTHTDCVITAPADNQLLIYSTGQWRNVTSPFLRLDGTVSMAGALNMNSQNITNAGQLNGKSVDTWITEHNGNNAKVSASASIDTHSDVLITGTPADNQLLIYSTGQWRNVTSPFLRLDGTVSMTGALNMSGFAISGASTYNGVNLTTLAVDSSVVKLTGDQTIAGTKTFSNAITATLGIASNDKITIAQDKPLIIGRTTRGLAAYTGGLELYGTSGVAGPHIQTFTATDPNYPIFRLISNGHSNVALKCDCYWDGASNDKSSSATSNFMISKGTNLLFQYASGVTVGNNVTFNTAMDINSTSGLLTTKAITASGAITANAGVSTTTLTTSDNIVVGAGKSVFIDRSGTTINNKLVLWDGGTPSTTAFLGFGVASQTFFIMLMLPLIVMCFIMEAQTNYLDLTIQQLRLQNQ